MPDTALDTAAMLMRGISEEEQIAMAIAASLQDSNENQAGEASETESTGEAENEEELVVTGELDDDDEEASAEAESAAAAGDGEKLAGIGELELDGSKVMLDAENVENAEAWHLAIEHAGPLPPSPANPLSKRKAREREENRAS